MGPPTEPLWEDKGGGVLRPAEPYASYTPADTSHVTQQTESKTKGLQEEKDHYSLSSFLLYKRRATCLRIQN